MKNNLPKCRVCGRRLTDPDSIAKEIGPECAQIAAARLGSAGVCAEALGIEPEIAADQHVARWLDLAETAALRGKTRDLNWFKEAAVRAADFARAARIEKFGIAA